MGGGDLTHAARLDRVRMAFWRAGGEVGKDAWSSWRWLRSNDEV